MKETIAKSISPPVYSSLLIMKARWIIFGALLLALAVSPPALRAMPRALSVSSCKTSKSQIRTNHAGRPKLQREVAYSLPAHRPATRLHRNRGKKLSIERGFVRAQGFSAPSRYVFSMPRARLQDLDGPNPSRGPPTQSL